ncbi:hypothetical protein AAG570_013990 [Ranatra chinensis]|uniref:Reverse transcriptase domain-containing protein n=1 Tax=Ranatra chinensis TaxID=642074 RepID=A0ABD0Z216_9HEMI
MNRLKVLQWNANSILDKYNELQQLINDTSPDIILIQESHVKNKCAYVISGFNTIITQNNRSIENYHNDNAITITELNNAIRISKNNKTPGIDSISNECLKNLPDTAKHKLLQIFNKSYNTVIIPNDWMTAIILPIPKSGKDLTKINSYRPITLLKMTLKILERIITNRLNWNLSNNNFFQLDQSRYRPQKSTIHALDKLITDIRQGYQKNKLTLAIFSTYRKAYDTVPTNLLLRKLNQIGIPPKMMKFFQKYLTNRKFHTIINKIYSTVIGKYTGIPQGWVISPTLFVLWIDDLLQAIKPPAKAIMYVDDLIIYTTTHTISTAKKIIQVATNNVRDWCNTTNTKINIEKTRTILFTNKSPYSIYYNLNKKNIKRV